MRYREFGNTGMRVSQIALGTWGMGDVGWDHHAVLSVTGMTYC